MRFWPFRLLGLVVAGVLFWGAAIRGGAWAGEPFVSWRAAAGRVAITPEGPMWMGGYASRDKPSEGVVQELFAKVLVLEDGAGERAALVTCDLLAITPLLRGRVLERVSRRHGIDSGGLLINASHTHCGPELRPPQAFRRGRGEVDAERARRYSLAVADKIAAMIGEALERLEPARLVYSRSRAGFAVNRRLPTDGGVINSPNPDGPVDHDVPVLAAYGADGELIAVLFGYACHNTTVKLYEFCGDYAGYAQQSIEQAHPGATALFLAGCGGDQNAYPRGVLELAQQQGRSLVNGVETALMTRRRRPVAGPLRSLCENVTLRFAGPPSRTECERRLTSGDRYERLHAQRLLDQLDRDGSIPADDAFPVQVMRFGDDLTLIALCGEAVVDYSRRLKRELRGGVDSTVDDPPPVWVAGYSNHVFGYLPSLRVLREGGYEGGRAMWHTDYPGPFDATVDRRVVAKVRELVERASVPRAAGGSTLDLAIRVDLGRDVGQNFGALLEGRDGRGRLRFAAGFLGAYNTRSRADRYKIHFFVRPASGHTRLVRRRLPQPTADSGVYLDGLDGNVYARSRGSDAGPRRWDADTGCWTAAPAAWRDDQNPTLVRSRRLCLRDGRVVYGDRVILGRPCEGSYLGLYYGQGYLFFYHRQQAVRPGAGGFNRVCAVPWNPYDDAEADRVRAIVVEAEFLREFPYAYGQLGSEVLNCSNVGGLYAFDTRTRRWRILVRPLADVSYQIYSMINYGDRLLMGHYPTGELLADDGCGVKRLEGWPPVLSGVSRRAREAQTTAIYGGDLFVGVWPWGELWRLDPDSQQWSFAGRMFSHPEPTDSAIHPYESLAEALGLERGSFGQRVTSLVPYGDGLMVGAASKRAGSWPEGAAALLSPGQREEYGAVHQLTGPANVAAALPWSKGAVTLRLVAGPGRMAVCLDGRELAAATLDPVLAKGLAEARVTVGRGLYGPFGGASLSVISRPSPETPP